jgi:hypothetical protein
MLTWVGRKDSTHFSRCTVVTVRHCAVTAGVKGGIDQRV